MDRLLASVIDHTNLKPDATPFDIKKLCNEAKEYGFFSVCVNPCYTSFAKQELEKSGVKVCVVCGFPLGANTTEQKVFEARQAINNGADEIDMVINVGMLKAGEYDYVFEDIRSVVKAVKEADVKVIIECCLLNDTQKIKAANLCIEAGAAFVKTSTGFSTGGATVYDVTLIKRTVCGKAKVKAAGGIKTKEIAIQMIEAGADRIGASASVEIVN